MGRRKGIVYEDFRSAGQRFCKLRVVIFFFRMKARIFKQQKFPRANFSNCELHRRSDAIIGLFHLPSQKL